MRYLHIFLLFIIADLYSFALYAQEKMLILTPSCFSDMVDTYIQSKPEMICTTLVCDTMESTQIKLRIDSLSHYFSADYLLIIGDHELIPSFPVQDGLSDIYYTCDSNAHTNIPVGRLPIQTAKELNNIIYKNSSTVISETITIASAEKSALTDKYDWERMRDISAILSQKNIRTIGEYFDGSREGLDAAGNPAAYDIITAVNQGVDLVLYAGHGDYSGWNTGMLTQNQLQHLNNTRYPIVIAAACNNGHFAGRTCMAETWLNSEYGAKAAIMSSALCDWDANLEALVYICNKLPAQSTLGKLWLKMYQYTTDSLHRHTEAQTWLLFGDPSMPITLPDKNGIKQMADDAICLYPNPADEKIFLHCDTIPSSILIYNHIGAVIQHITPADTHIEIDISSWASGCYIVKIDEKIARFCKQ